MKVKMKTRRIIPLVEGLSKRRQKVYLLYRRAKRLPGELRCLMSLFVQDTIMGVQLAFPGNH